MEALHANARGLRGRAFFSLRFGTWMSVVVSVCAIVAGCGEPSADFDQFMAEGRLEQEAGRYAEAVGMFKGAAEQDRERPEPSYRMGRCYLAMADKKFASADFPGALSETDRAIAAFDDAISAFPGYGAAVQGKVDALKMRNRQSAALELAEWAAANSGLQAQKLIIKAKEYALAGDMDRAELYFSQAVEVEQDNAAAHAERGLFYMRCGNDPAAIRSLKRAYRLNPAELGVARALKELGASSEVVELE